MKIFQNWNRSDIIALFALLISSISAFKTSNTVININNQFSQLKAKTAKINDLRVINSRIDNLKSDIINTIDFKAINSKIKNLSSEVSVIKNLKAGNTDIGNCPPGKVPIQWLDSAGSHIRCQ